MLSEGCALCPVFPGLDLDVFGSAQIILTIDAVSSFTAYVERFVWRVKSNAYAIGCGGKSNVMRQLLK